MQLFSGSSSAADTKATKTSLRTFYEAIAHILYGIHHNMTDRYEISISQLLMNTLLFTSKNVTGLTVYMGN